MQPVSNSIRRFLGVDLVVFVDNACTTATMLGLVDMDEVVQVVVVDGESDDE